MVNARQDSEGKSVRTLRVAEQVRHALADVLGRGEVRDPDLEGVIVSVTEVRITPDLRHATAYVKPLATGDETLIIKALARNAKFLRGEISRRVQLRYAPDLRFRRDESFDAAGRIDAILRSPQVARDLDPA